MTTLCRCGDYLADHQALPGGERGRCICGCPEFREAHSRPPAAPGANERPLGHVVTAEPTRSHACWRSRADFDVDDDEWRLRNVAG